MALSNIETLAGAVYGADALPACAPAGWQQPLCYQTAPAGTPMTVVVVRDAAELATHMSAWDELALAALEPNVFYESWLALPAWRAWNNAEDLRFVLIYAPNPTRKHGPPVLCGVFPFVRRRLFKGLPLHYLSLWQYKYCKLCTPLVHAEYAADCLRALLAWLGREAESGAYAEFGGVSGDGPFFQLLVDHFNQSKNLMVVSEDITRALLQRGADGQSYINAALSGKRRKELRRQEKLLAELGAVEYAALTPGGDAAIWLEQFLRLEAQGWKGREGSAFTSHEADHAFFLAAMTEAERRGRLQMLALRLNGRPIAFKLNLLAGEGSFAYKITFDEEFAAYSPGVHLELENIQRVHAEPEIKWMDSCATREHFMINRLWTARRTIKTLMIATGKDGGNFIIALRPLLRWFKRKFFDRIVNRQQAGDFQGGGEQR
jgi:CelD/BcsL family acetyltransferase involved in cellulose biosynthesis